MWNPRCHSAEGFVEWFELPGSLEDVSDTFTSCRPNLHLELLEVFLGSLEILRMALRRFQMQRAAFKEAPAKLDPPGKVSYYWQG